MPFLIDTAIDPKLAHERETVRPQDLAYLAHKADMVVAAGAKLGDNGSLGPGSFRRIDVGTRAEAEAFLRADTYVEAALIRGAALVRVREGFSDHRQVQGLAMSPR